MSSSQDDAFVTCIYLHRLSIRIRPCFLSIFGWPNCESIFSNHMEGLQLSIGNFLTFSFFVDLERLAQGSCWQNWLVLYSSDVIANQNSIIEQQLYLLLYKQTMVYMLNYSLHTSMRTYQFWQKIPFGSNTWHNLLIPQCWLDFSI